MIIKETDAPDFACCRSPAEACVGESCMAWRWINRLGGKEIPETGYCGLAGKP